MVESDLPPIIIRRMRIAYRVTKAVGILKHVLLFFHGSTPHRYV